MFYHSYKGLGYVCMYDFLMFVVCVRSLGFGVASRTSDSEESSALKKERGEIAELPACTQARSFRTESFALNKQRGTGP